MSSNNKRTHIWIVAFQRVFALSSSQCKWYLDFLLLPKHEPWPCVFTNRWWPFSGPGDKTKCTKCNLSVLGLCAVLVMDKNKAEHLLFLGTLSRSPPQSFASHCAQTPGQPLACPEQRASHIVYPAGLSISHIMRRSHILNRFSLDAHICRQDKIFCLILSL